MDNMVPNVLPITRADFEERIFNFRFVQSIQKVHDGMLGLQSINCPFMDEFVRKDEKGHYLEPFVAGAFWALHKFGGIKE